MIMERITKNVIPLLLLTCLATAVGDVTLTTTPGEINIGLTKTLHVDCSYKLDANSSINGLVAFFISRAKNESSPASEYEDIASINVYAKNVSIFTSEPVSASGVISSDGVSHINISWTNPTARQSGLYKCDAHGIDAVGHTIEVSDSSQVTTKEPSQNELLDKLEEMDEKLISMEQKFLELYSKLNEVPTTPASISDVTTRPCIPAPCCVQTHESGMCPIGDFFEQLLFYPYNLTYNGHDYNIIRTPAWGVHDAMELCHSAGSYLVEIDDTAEYQAVSQFLNGQEKVKHAAIAGQYQHGQWYYQRSGHHVGFTKWKGGEEPDYLYYLSLPRCIALTKDSHWMMEPAACNENNNIDPLYALCESSVSSPLRR